MKISKRNPMLRWFVAVALGVLVHSGAQAKGLPDNALARARAALPTAEFINLDGRGVPNFVTGRLGQLDTAKPEASAVRFMQDIAPAFQGSGQETFQARPAVRDEMGQTHVRVQQYLHNLPVVNADLVIHSDSNSGEVMGVNGNFAPAQKVDRVPSVSSREALSGAIAQAGILNGKNTDKPALTYIVDQKGAIRLAWAITVQYTDKEGPQVDRIFADATNGQLIERHPQICYVKNRKTYNLNHGTTLPGTLVLQETSGSTTDTVLQTTHTNIGYVWDYYWNVHSRDSFDGAGATLISSTHYSNNYVNAYWNSTQMVYGDGDGVQSGPLNVLDVTGHEMTHAVTERTANLVYSGESGGLNEANSDIFGAAVERKYRDGGVVNSKTWLVGEDCWTPGTAGDALRYMNDPARDGGSLDYWTSSAGSVDVHYSSGIPNLAFYLLSQGGTHPRGKSTINVTGIGMDKAEKIFYRALTTYYTSSSNFASARNGTISAATDLYGAGSQEVISTGDAWSAVGVAQQVTANITLATYTNQSAATGAATTYTQVTPAGAHVLEFTTSGGTGDADLYVKFGSAPTDTVYDCRPYASGNAETCTINPASQGTYYVRIKAYSAFSGLTLTVKSDVAAGSSTPTPVPPTATPVPPTATRTPTPPPAATNTPTRTNTPAPPTNTPAGPTNTPIPATATPVPPTATPVPGGTEKIVNGGFESTLTPWTKSGTGAYNTTAGSYPHGGTGYAYLGNVNSVTAAKIYQQVTVPSNATLSFWLNTVSNETTTTTKYDYLYVEVTNTSGTVLGTLGTYSNLDKTTAGTYVQKSFSLASYAGQTVRVQFRATTDSSMVTTFRLDDVSVK